MTDSTNERRIAFLFRRIFNSLLGSLCYTFNMITSLIFSVLFTKQTFFYWKHNRWKIASMITFVSIVVTAVSISFFLCFLFLSLLCWQSFGSTIHELHENQVHKNLYIFPQMSSSLKCAPGSLWWVSLPTELFWKM